MGFQRRLFEVFCFFKGLEGFVIEQHIWFSVFSFLGNLSGQLFFPTICSRSLEKIGNKSLKGS